MALDEDDVNERTAPTIFKIVEDESRGVKMMEEGKELRADAMRCRERTAY